MTGHDPNLDAAAHSVWLHGDWRWLTRNMTVEEREAFADACDRHTATWPPDAQGSPVDRWWRDDKPPHPVQPTAGHVYLVVDHGGGGIVWVGTDHDRAREFARNTGCVVAQLPIAADYRPEGARQ